MKQQVSPGIIAVTIVVVLGLIGATAYMMLGKKQDMPNKNASNPQYQNYMNGTGSGGGLGDPSGGAPSHGMSAPASYGPQGSSGGPQGSSQFARNH